MYLGLEYLVAGGFLMVSASLYFFFLRTSKEDEPKKEETKKPKNSNRNKKRQNKNTEPVEEKNNNFFKISQLLGGVSLSIPEAQDLIQRLLVVLSPAERSRVLPEVAEKESVISRKKVEIRSLELMLKNAQDELNFVSKTSKGVEDSYLGRITSLEGEIDRMEKAQKTALAAHAQRMEDLEKQLSQAVRAEEEERGKNKKLSSEKARLEKELEVAKTFNGREVAEEKEKLIQAVQEEITATNRKFIAAANRAEALKKRMEGVEESGDKKLLEKLAMVESKVGQLTGEVARLTNEKQRAEAELRDAMLASSMGCDFLGRGEVMTVDGGTN